jgi:hypothetical protein
LAFNFYKAKAAARRVIHKTLSVQAFYKDSNMSAPVELTMRWHHRRNAQGALDGNGNFAEVFEDIDVIIFNEEELSVQSVTPKRGCKAWVANLKGEYVTLDSQLSGPADDAVVFELSNKLPSTGAINQEWEVV